IARRYDLTNTVLSAGVHHHWRRVALCAAGDVSGRTALDICTGTGDLAFLLCDAVGPSGNVLGVDFVAEMLALAPTKSHRSRTADDNITFARADAMSLPVGDAACDLVTIGFGIRNVDDPLACLIEIRRVLRPGGKLVVLEFGAPRRSLIGWLYRGYAAILMPF